MSLNAASITVSANGQEQLQIGPDSLPYSANLAFSVAFSDNAGSPGSVAKTASSIFHYKNATVAQTTGVTLNLNSLTGNQHPGGSTMVFTNIKGIVIVNQGVVDLLVFNASSTPFQGPMPASTQFTLSAGGMFAVGNPSAAGWVCTSNKNLLIAGSGGAGAVEMLIIGDATLS